MVAYPSSIPPRRSLVHPSLHSPSGAAQKRQEELERVSGVDWTRGRGWVDGEVEIEKAREAATDYTNEK